MMKINNLYDYTTMSRAEIDGVRYYNTPDGGKLPSVTTILSATKDKDVLKDWIARVGEAEANRIKNEAALLGTQIHSSLENYIHGKESVGSPLARILADLIIKKGMSKVSEVWGAEIALYSKGLYAGTTDVIGVFNGKPAIIDFKNSLKEKKLEWIDDYRAQLGAYALAHNEMYGTNINQGVIMIALRNAGYQEFVFEGKDFDDCINLWLTRLTAYYEQKSNL